MKHLKSLTIHPLNKEYTGCPELSLGETGVILESIIKRDQFVALKKLRLTIDTNPMQ
jgi:hypothetical protein